MVKSMTGFGRCEETFEHRRVIVELKSVNHRYLDLNVKTPSKLNFLEVKVRSYLKERLERGKVDIYIGYFEDADSGITVQYNPAIAAMYLDNLKKMSEEFGLENDIRLSHLSRFQDVFEIQEAESDEDELWSYIEGPLQRAVDAFIETRIQEGNHLKEDLLSKLTLMDEYVDVIEKRSPEIIEEYKARLIEKVHQLLLQDEVTESRIASEVTLYADKICVDEEIVRLRSHIEEMRKCLQNGDDVGRRLDFIAQEMNREANTILSKSTDAEIANLGIDLKTLIEKIREQIQNLE